MRTGLILIFLTWLWAGVMLAQTVEEFPALQQKWEATAQRAEEVINDPEANEAELISLRQQLDLERQEITKYITEAETRAAPLLDQRETLGPVPETGEEPSEVAAVRRDLEGQIDRENGPLLAARQIRERVNADIVTIDRIQRKRFSEQLLTRTDFPLSIDALFEFFDDLDTTIKNIWRGITDRWVSLTAAGYASSVLPANIVIFLVGFGLITVGARVFRNRIVKLADVVFGGFLTRKLLSFINVFVVELLGYAMVVWAIRRTGFRGVEAPGLLDTVYYVIFLALAAKWISRIARHEKREFGSGAVLVLAAIFFGIDWNLPRLVDIAPWDARSITVAHFFIVSIYFPLIYNISRPAHFYGYFERPDHAGALRATEAARLVLRYSNWIILLLALVGYYALSRQILIAIGATFGLGLVGYWVFQTITEFGFNIIGRLRGEPTLDDIADDDDDDASADDMERSALWPVLVAVGVVAVILPLLLIAWGLDANLLLEIWVTLVQGFTVGGIRLSLGAIAGFAIAFLIGYFVVKGLQTLLEKLILPRTRMEIGARTAIVSLFGYIGYSLAAVFAFSAAGFDLGSLAVIFGALSVGIGFGLQNIVSNFVSGIILLVERPIKKGDWISVAGNEGYVRDIKVRATEIETFDRATVVIPNSDLISQPVLNWVYSGKVARIRIPIGVSYDSDPNFVHDTLIDVANESKWARRIPAPQAVLLGFGDSTLNFELRFHVTDADNTVVATSDLNLAVFKKFKEVGIDIPFPIRDIRITRDTGAKGRRVGKTKR